jgi:1-acyl-sn-glycerol-3-phosphate acyltransferase
MTEDRLLALHARARALRGERMRLYRLVRLVLRPLLFLLFRPQVEGAEHVPAAGGALLAANHRSFFDSFFQALVIRRPMHWMAKVELFDRRIAAWFLVRLGAFPVRRGKADTLALDTARHLLAEGELVSIFPEGTRVREGIGHPHKGAARLALEAGAPMVPMGIVGTERGSLRRALWRRGERVRMTIEPPVAVTPVGEVELPAAAAELTDDRVWPRVTRAVTQLETKRAIAVSAGTLGALGALGVVLARRRRR